MGFTLWRGIVGMVRPTALPVALVAGALACSAAPANAQSQVAVLIGTTSGGGYDLYARARRGTSAATCRASRLSSPRTFQAPAG
jgi:hypothetical protein